jgi:lysophospholipase L1-like esterase
MVRAAAALPATGASLILIDVTEEFSDEQGAIIEDLTYDGLHTNEAGRAAIRAKVEQLLRDTADDRA